MTARFAPACHLPCTASHCSLPETLRYSHQTPGTSLPEQQPSGTPVPPRSRLCQGRLCFCWPLQPQNKARTDPHRPVRRFHCTDLAAQPSPVLCRWHAGASPQGSTACVAPVPQAVLQQDNPVSDSICHPSRFKRSAVPIGHGKG